MQIKNVLVEEIILTSPARIALARAALHQFGERRWVSQHHGRGKTRVGPMTVVDASEEQGDPKTSVTRFGERGLHQEGESKLVISYRETWTAPPWTIFALVLPKFFVASTANFNLHGDGSSALQVGVTETGQLFYHAVLGWANDQHVFDVEARVEEDERYYSQMVKSSAAVEGTSNFKTLRRAVGQKALSLDFWLKLLEVGGRIVGHK